MSKRKFHWIIPASIALIIFIGEVASHLVAISLEPFIGKYQIVIWIIFSLALIATIVMAILEWRDEEDAESPDDISPGSPPGIRIDANDISIGGDFVAGDKVTTTQEQAGQSPKKTSEDPPEMSLNINLKTGRDIIIGGDFTGRDKITMIIQLPEHPVENLHQIPPPPADFSGRDEDIRKVLDYFHKGSVMSVGIWGLAGVGKTAMALAIADLLKKDYPDAQIFLDLRGMSPTPLSPEEVMAYVIHSFHPGIDIREDKDFLKGYYHSLLNGKRALLIFDNAAGKDQVEPLIPPTGCGMMITSRGKFSLPGMKTKDLEILEKKEAENLLLKIAPRIGGYSNEIARYCGYLPIALRTVACILADRSDIIVSTYLHDLEVKKVRFNEVDASFFLSYELLQPEFQQYWAQLSIFDGGFDCEAAAAVWGLGQDTAAGILSDLVKWNLVEHRMYPTGKDSSGPESSRYSLHDLVRDFCDHRIIPGSRGLPQSRHATYYCDILSRARELYLKGGDKSMAGLSLLDREWKNILWGWAWTEAQDFSNRDAAVLCCRYATTGEDLLIFRMYSIILEKHLERALVAVQFTKDSCAEARITSLLGSCYISLGDPMKAIEFHRKAWEMQVKNGDKRGEGSTLGRLGLDFAELGEIPTAITCHQNHLRIATETGDNWEGAMAISNLGLIYGKIGDYNNAIKFDEQALALFIKNGDLKGQGSALNNLGFVYHQLNQLEKSLEYYNQRLDLARMTGDLRGMGTTLCNMGDAYRLQGKRKEALECGERSKKILEDIRSPVLGNLLEWYLPLLEETR